MTCDKCKKEVLRIRATGNGGWSCGDCFYVPQTRFSASSETVFLKDYGKVSKARINELKRRVILPYNRKDGGYYLGRMGENGKVQEREPSY